MSRQVSLERGVCTTGKLAEMTEEACRAANTSLRKILSDKQKLGPFEERRQKRKKNEKTFRSPVGNIILSTEKRLSEALDGITGPNTDSF